MKKLFMLVGILLVVALVVGSFGCAKPAVPAKDLIMQGGPVGGAAYGANLAMAETWNKYVEKPSKVKVTVEPVVAMAEAFKRLDKREVDLVWMAGSFAYYMSRGLPPYQDYGKRTFYVLSGGGISTYHFFTTDPNIKSVKDLKGKRVSGKLAGSPSGDYVREAMFKLYGMTDNDIKLLTHTVGAEAARQVQEGVADVGFTISGIPSSWMVELAAAKPIYWIPLTAQEIEAVIATQPHMFKGVIPARSYKGQDVDVPSLSTAQGIFSRLDFDQELTYEMVKALYEHQKEFFGYHAAAAEWVIELAAKEARVYPVSPGAIKYYKEKGIWTSELEARQKELLKAFGL